MIYKGIAATVWFLTLTAASGCGVYRSTYDISATAPFASYVGKDVVLTREAMLVMESTQESQNASVPYALVYPQDPGVPLLPKSYRHIVLSPGTHVHITSVKLRNEQHEVLDGNFKFAQLIAQVTFRVDAKDWPANITAIFDYSTNQGSTLSFGKFQGSVRPAPWEPLETPPTRNIPWPTHEFLISEDK